MILNLWYDDGSSVYPPPTDSVRPFSPGTGIRGIGPFTPLDAIRKIEVDPDSPRGVTAQVIDEVLWGIFL